jgi:hypothetical protein
MIDGAARQWCCLARGCKQSEADLRKYATILHAAMIEPADVSAMLHRYVW